MKKRILAALLSAVMAFTMIPFMGVTAYAENTKGPGDEYVSLPITIRDYAADGMLFEWNEEDTQGPQNVGATVVQPTLRITTKSGGDKFSTSEQTGFVRYTATSDGTYLTYSIGNYNRTAIRYCVVSFRTNSAVKSGYTPTIGHRWNNGSAKDYKNFAQTGYNKGLSADFFNQVTDLGGGNETVSYVTFYPRIPKGKIIDIAYIAFFANKADADNYAKNATGNNGKNYTGGNNMQFGFLMGNNATHDYSGQGVQTHMDSYLGTDTAVKVNANNTPAGVVKTLPNGAKETVLAGNTRTGLVQPQLDANKHMVYNKSTVDYLAWLLENTLTVKESNGGNSYNFNYVMGAKVYNDNGTKKELAAVLRESIKSVGTYEEAKTKYDAGQLLDAKNCVTYYDAAYFLLHNTFADSKGYGQTISNYNSLRLMKRTADDGSTYYCFNSAYNNTDYNYAGGYIANTGFVYDQIYHQGWNGISIPKLRFDPIGNNGYGKNGSIYHELTGNESAEYYNNTNYNMTLEGHAQFVYYEDDNLYFTFTGDDDVYLFVNGKLVMDLGGAHSISKVKIKLNDVRDLCGLKDGQAYDFDFYYMERHGIAANFGIDTNIKIVDPSMLTEKIAYQDGVNVGNYGFVDANKPVRYQFKLTNNGDAKVEELTFKDNVIGVSLSKDTISLNTATAITELYASVVGKDGITKASYSAGELTEDGLKALLKNGLEIGDTISIFGFNYKIPDGSWSNDKFTNTVYTTAISRGENASHRTLNGIASCTVQQQHYKYTGIHYYEWMGKGVTATKAELIEAVTKAGVTNPGTDIQLCGPNGKTDSTAVNKNAKVTADGITYTGTKTGSDTYYYKVGNYGPVAVTIYSYDVADNIYVLDYSLPVELNGADFGLMVNDTLSLAENKYPTTASTLGITDGSATKNYGTFAYGTETNATSLKYTMNSFMNGEDSVKIKVQVLEDGASAVTTKTGVVMEETVKVVPANVVYYEDDFPGITYINEGENGWAHYKTNDSEGNEQSADQDSPYGSDPNYSKDKETTYTKLVLDTSDLNAYQQNVIDYLNQQLGLIGGDSSNGSLSVLEVKETKDVMSFEFRGTGFEIVSRTTQEQYAVVSVKVERKNDENNYTVVKQFPVITESKGGDLYQVPIISVTGMDAAEYKVTLAAAGSTVNKTRVLYIDGVRIYEPLEGLDYADYYNPDEAQAKFYEIKSLIGDKKAIYADISTTGDEIQLVTGATLIEGTDQLLGTTEDVDQYLKLGPNNELYLDGSASNSFLAFYLSPIEGVAENARTIEIGAHRKAEYGLFVNNAPASLVYGSTADAVIGRNNVYTVASGTEQYYEIDPGKLVFDKDNNRYLLLIGSNEGDGEASYAALALTNLKVSGYTIGIVEYETKAAAAANAIENSPVLREFMALRDHYKALAPQEPVEEPSEEPVEEPAINEELVINSAVLKATKIVSGKNATLTAKVSGDAASIVVLDADGNAVEFKKVASNEKNGIVTFQAVWTVTGNRGDVLNFTVVVYDSNGLRSVNTLPITVTIK
ncbi:MAG: fibro-slime domain-containing protein [Eubacteriales bacterium]|nr:fibro-slime domain-containing protein [Christensenellaceae bacterium]MDY2747883.1 fibro-slime domain-containing protein [Eubacteriales bacterium]